MWHVIAQQRCTNLHQGSISRKLWVLLEILHVSGSASKPKGLRARSPNLRQATVKMEFGGKAKVRNLLHLFHTYIHTLHYITLHYITLHYITLHYITLHYITLHYITLHYIHTYLPKFAEVYRQWNWHFKFVMSTFPSEVEHLHENQKIVCKQADLEFNSLSNYMTWSSEISSQIPLRQVSVVANIRKWVSNHTVFKTFSQNHSSCTTDSYKFYSRGVLAHQPLQSRCPQRPWHCDTNRSRP